LSDQDFFIRSRLLCLFRSRSSMTDHF
jgi:hypothetical protein